MASMPKTTRKPRRSKSAKVPRQRQTTREHLLPYPEFPLFPHGSGRWAKKIRGKLHYFGRWDAKDGDNGWQAAIDDYKAKVDDLKAGRTPRVGSEGLTIRDLVNRFLTTKRHLVDASELSAHTFNDYHATCARVVEAFGLTRLVIDLASDDFEAFRAQLAKIRGPVALGNEIQRVRVLFKYGFDAGLIDRPVRYGSSFKRPNKKTLRKARLAKGQRMFEAPELRRIIARASVQMRAMILLGVNAGFGNNDVATLPVESVDLKAGWINHPRPKTAIQRRCPLWPETVQAVKAAIDNRPAPKRPEAEALLFVTKYGGSWSKTPALATNHEAGTKVKRTTDNPVAKEMRKLLDELGLHRAGLGFYALRHTFETIGGDARDQVAVNAIMGHVDNTMAGEYRERISDERLNAVTDHVRRWLWPPKAKRKNAKKAV
jgi:integrase